MGASGLNYNDVIVQLYNLDRIHTWSPSTQFTVNKYDNCVENMVNVVPSADVPSFNDVQMAPCLSSSMFVQRNSLDFN